MAQVDAQGRRRSAWRDLRATVRYRCAPATFGRVLIDGQGDQEYQKAWLADLSQGGAGLCMARPVAVETALHIVLRNPANNQRLVLQAVVAHATERVSGDWLIGCTFASSLSEEQLDDLLS